MGIGNFGLTELFVIVVLVLIFFGPGEMPEIARTLARFLRDVRRNVNEIMREFEDLDRATRDRSGGPERGDERSGGPRPGERVLPPEARDTTRPSAGDADEVPDEGTAERDADGNGAPEDGAAEDETPVEGAPEDEAPRGGPAESGESA